MSAPPCTHGRADAEEDRGTSAKERKDGRIFSYFQKWGNDFVDPEIWYLEFLFVCLFFTPGLHVQLSDLFSNHFGGT